MQGGDMKMGLLESNSALILQRSMNFLWTKQSCILDNIANAETPNYKTKYATFEESLDNAIRQAAGEKQGKNAAFREAIEDSQLEVHQAQESMRMDDNGINITEQAVELARNGYQLQYVMDSISSDFSILRTAIRG